MASILVSDNTALDNADDNESTPKLLTSRSEERAVDRAESMLESDDAVLDTTVDSDSPSELLA